MSEAPSAEALQQAMAGLTHKDGPKDGVGAAAFAAAKEDIAAKAVLKDIRSSTAALASVTPMEALNKWKLAAKAYLLQFFKLPKRIEI